MASAEVERLQRETQGVEQVAKTLYEAERELEAEWGRRGMLPWDQLAPSARTRRLALATRLLHSGVVILRPVPKPKPQFEGQTDIVTALGGEAA